VFSENISFKDILGKYWIAEIFLGALVLFLFLTNLGNIYLWQDEAQRALIAKTILHDGFPRGYDGLNYFSQELGREYGDNFLWKWNPWLPFYVLALFFSAHISTFTARLPFALFGIATVALAYLFVRTILGERRSALLAAIILTTSVPFLLLSRQCNYYSMTAFFSLLSLYGYIRMTTGKKHGFILTLTSITLLFHSHYIYCVPCVVAMLGHALIYHRNIIKKLFTLYVAVLVVNIPGFFWYGHTAYGGVYKLIHSGANFVMFFNYYLGQTVIYIFTIPVVLSLAALWGIASIRKKRFFFLDHARREIVVLLLSFIITCTFTLSVVSPAPFFRYLSPIIPLAAILIALFVEAVWCHRIIWGLLVLALWFGSQPIIKYLYELTHDYHGPIGGIVRFINSNSQHGDVVGITYGDMPVKFYTGLRVVGGLTGEDLEPIKNAKWVIVRKHTLCSREAVVRKFILNNVNFERYEAIQLNVPDIPFENRESPQLHEYKTVQDEDPVIIYKRIRP
jgi:hypothetical protein